MPHLLFFLLSGTIREISTKISNEIIVYNTPGISTIGIRTGKILNLYSDTTFAGAEIKRHCSTLGLKMNMNRIGNRSDWITAGKTNILITGSLNKKTMAGLAPDIVILTGPRPEIEYGNDTGSLSEITVIAAEGIPRFISSPHNKVRNSGCGICGKKVRGIHQTHLSSDK